MLTVFRVQPPSLRKQFLRHLILRATSTALQAMPNISECNAAILRHRSFSSSAVPMLSAQQPGPLFTPYIVGLHLEYTLAIPSAMFSAAEISPTAQFDW